MFLNRYVTREKLTRNEKTYGTTISAKSYYNSTKNNRIRTHYFHQVLT